PIWIELANGTMPRVAVAVRAGNEVLGSIWAAVPRRLSPERERALTEAAGFVALHLLRHRMHHGAQGGIEAELVATVLQGGGLAGEAAHRLGIEGEGYRVVAVGVAQPDELS